MADRHLLYLDANGLRAWHWQGGRLTPEPFFSATESGHNGFAAWLALRQDARFTLVADCVEEGFQLETLPYVAGPDRKALLARKQGQLFYGSPFVVSLPLGRERSGRRDERLLFAALTRPAMLEPWVERLRGADAILTGITSTAFLIGEALTASLKSQPRMLVVCLSPAGVRQTLFDEGKLRFSRLATTADTNTASWESSIPFEVQKTYQYLVAQRILARGAALNVSILGHPEEAAALRTACRDSELLRYQIINLEELASSTGLHEPLSRSDVLPVLLHLAARHQGVPQFAPVKDRINYRWWVARRTTYAMGVIGLLAMLGLSAKTLLEARQLQNATAEIALEAQGRALRYDHLLNALPRLPAPLETLRTSVSRLSALQSLASGPGPALKRLSHTLDRHPEVRLRRVDWSLGPQALEQLGKSEPRATSPNAPIPPRRAGSATPPVAPAYLVLIEASLPDDSPLSQRETLDALNTFVADLQQDGAIEASLVHLPFEFASDRTLRNTTAQDKQTLFSVQISYPAEHAR